MIPPRKKLNNFKIFLNFLFLLIISILFVFDSNVCHADNSQSAPKKVLIGGWYSWDPYQYLVVPGDPKSLTGLDYEIEKQIMEKAGYQIDLPEVSWKQHTEDLVEGKRDFAMGAFSSKKREEYNYLTVPYRYEENSVFMLREDEHKHDYETIPEFIARIKDNNYRIGIVDGYRYANDDFNKFIEDPENEKYFVKSASDNDNMHLLLAKKINAFIADKIVGATIIWREKKGRLISEAILTDSKAPVYMLLSKKTVSAEEYQRINNVVKDYIKSDDYKKLVSWYLYPLLLMETVDSSWFYLIEILGIASFAVSGIFLAYRLKASLLGTFLIALLPSFGGGIFRDLIFGRYPVEFLLSSVYILVVLVIVLLGFFSIKLLGILKNKISQSQLEKIMKPFSNHKDLLEHFLVITDAVGLASFTISGVLICMLAKLSPLWLWGPFIAFLSGAGGALIRDIIVKDIQKGDKPITAINGEIYGEIAVVWGGILALYLFLTADNVDAENIQRMVFVSIAGVFITRLLVHFYNIPNLTLNEQNLKNRKEH